MWQRIREAIVETIRTEFIGIILLGYWLYRHGLLRSIYQWVIGLLGLR
jgi:hypothetical protein